MQGPVMVHHPRGRMCVAESLHYGAAWRHGTAQGLQERKSRAYRARHEVTIESLTYKFIELQRLVFPIAQPLPPYYNSQHQFSTAPPTS